MGSEKFLGRYFHSIDDKSRVAIPHKFRTVLGGENQNRVVVTLSSNPKFTYLDVYPAEEWNAILDRILDMDTEGEEALEEHEALLANYVHPAQDLEIDRQGRVLLPQEHRDFAGIEKEVVYTGDGSKFRLWAKPQWERYDAAMREARSKIRGIPRRQAVK